MLVTLPLYVLRELGKNLLPALLIYSFCILPFFLLRLLREDIDLWTVLSITPLIFPFIANIVLPPTILTGTVMAYGRVGSDNEYAAALAGGVWPGWVVLPAAAVGLIAALMSLYLNERVLTYSTNRISRALVEGHVTLLERRLRRQGVVRLGNYHIYRFARTERGNQALDVTTYREPARKRALEAAGRTAYEEVADRIVAADHTFEVRREEGADDTDYNVIRLHLRGCTLLSIKPDGTTDPVHMASYTHPLRIEADIDSPISPDRVECWGVSKILREMRQRTVEYRQRRTDLLTRLQEARTEQQRSSTQTNLRIYAEDFRESMSKYRRALHTRLALSFACILFSLVGTFLGLILEHGARSERFVAGLATAGGFFILFILCRAVSETVGGWVIWLPNVALLGVAAYLWRRMFWVA
jgi:lipopolysaccharide export LptBFGC system permease protein LptF